MIKGLLLAVLLAVSANVSAQEVGRQSFIAQCESQAQKAGNVYSMSNAVCNCSAQMISYVLSGERSRYDQWAVDIQNPVIQGSIDSCVDMSNQAPYKFLQYFGSESASIR